MTTFIRNCLSLGDRGNEVGTLDLGRFDLASFEPQLSLRTGQQTLRYEVNPDRATGPNRAHRPATRTLRLPPQRTPFSNQARRSCAVLSLSLAESPECGDAQHRMRLNDLGEVTELCHLWLRERGGAFVEIVDQSRRPGWVVREVRLRSIDDFEPSGPTPRRALDDLMRTPPATTIMGTVLALAGAFIVVARPETWVGWVTAPLFALMALVGAREWRQQRTKPCAVGRR